MWLARTNPWFMAIATDAGEGERLYSHQIRRVLTLFRGREVKTTSDGFLAISMARSAASIASALLPKRSNRAAGLHTSKCEMMATMSAASQSRRARCSAGWHPRSIGVGHREGPGGQLRVAAVAASPSRASGELQISAAERYLYTLVCMLRPQPRSCAGSRHTPSGRVSLASTSTRDTS